ncbi:hypothetical protein SAMN05444422_101378 [Halobiforma haloterrestris]|uniref:PH domain-containing protein n=1 Tax=Natronobacterium haloterrestre TaxID=148448 RepID=A0A1I1D7U5_NATHA|nr:hypothetical protein [Halobiforma haloterrestris]SFB70995.1 hypothetical protein SAMN05444422_101378 [Halobiforma haloterrestris]
MSLEHGRPLADPEPPDIGFQAGFGFYLGLVAGGFAAVVGAFADVAAVTLLGVLPTTVTAVTIVGHVLGKRAVGLPERIGRSRRTRAVPYLPAIAFGVVAFVPGVTALTVRTRHLVVTAIFALVVGVAGFGLERLCRNRYVEAVTADDPVVSWNYEPAGFLQGGAWALLVALAFVAGVTSLVAGNAFGLFWIAYAVLVIAWDRFDFGGNGAKRGGKRFSLDTGDTDRTVGELRAHRRGIRLDRGRASKLVPWERISGVELTDDELVLERSRRFDLRCDRDAIDDPEAVLEGIERARRRETETVDGSK